VENLVVPNLSAPRIEVAASLAEVGRSAGVSHLRGVVTLTNQGKATAWVPQAIAAVQATGVAGGPVTKPGPGEVVSTLDPLTYDGDAFSRALPPGAGSGLVWLEDLAPYRTTLPPGV
jgi:hypothetical protein